MVFLSLTLPSLTQPPSVLPKFDRNLGVLRKDSLSQVSRAALLGRGTRGTRLSARRRLPAHTGRPPHRLHVGGGSAGAPGGSGRKPAALEGKSRPRPGTRRNTRDSPGVWPQNGGMVDGERSRQPTTVSSLAHPEFCRHHSQRSGTSFGSIAPTKRRRPGRRSAQQRRRPGDRGCGGVRVLSAWRHSRVTLQRRRQAETLRTHGNGYAPLPMVILLNQESASAAEIMASALHDAKAATLVGTRSFGKGTIQRYIPLGDGSGLKFTSARYRTPAGVYIHGTGITPDVSETGDALARGVQLLRQRLAASV